MVCVCVSDCFERLLSGRKRMDVSQSWTEIVEVDFEKLSSANVSKLSDVLRPLWCLGIATHGHYTASSESLALVLKRS